MFDVAEVSTAESYDNKWWAETRKGINDGYAKWLKKRGLEAPSYRKTFSYGKQQEK